MKIDMFSHKEFVNRLNLFMKNINKNGNELAKIARVKPQAISGYKKNSFPKAEVLTAWSYELNLNINWLLTGEGEMLGGGGERRPPTPHIDVTLLQKVIEALEEYLQKVKGKLSPTRKAVVVSQLYELIVEQEEQAREPIQMMRLVMGALATAVNE